MRILLTLFSITFLFTFMFITDLYADGHEAAAEKEVDVEALEIEKADKTIDETKKAVEKEATEVKEKVESEAGKKVDSMKEGEIEKAMDSAEEKVDAASDKTEDMDSTVVEEKMDSMTKEGEAAVEEVAPDSKDASSEMKETETMQEKVETEAAPDQESIESGEGEEAPPAMVDSEMETTEDAEMLVEEPPVPVVEKEVTGGIVSLGPNSITVRSDSDNQEYALSHEGLESVQNVETGYRVWAVFDEANNGLLNLKVLGVPVVAKPLIIKTKPK